MTIGKDDHVKVAADVHVREFDGELVILDLAKGDYFGVNEIGARLWQGLASGKSPSEVATAIAPEYEVEPDVLVADLVALANDFAARGLVTP